MTGLLSLLAAGLLAASPAVVRPQFHLVYDGQESGYALVRTPQLLLTREGTLLALAQGRSGSHDQSDNDILLKRSEDGGRTWSKFQVIADQGKDALNSICIVQDRDSGRIVVIGCSFPAGYSQKEFASLSPGMQEYQRRYGRENYPVIQPGHEGNKISRNYVVHSDDDGRTWSAMRDVTSMVKPPPPALSCVPGPGLAIQLTEGSHTGRIVVPCNSLIMDPEQNPPRYTNLPYAVLSDDGGKTWSRGQFAPVGKTGTTQTANESQVVELPGGRLMMNSRSSGRVTMTSQDGGVTWSPMKDEPALKGPATAAGFLRYDPVGSKDGQRLLFSYPTQDNRQTGAIFLSPDNGKSWPVSKVLRPDRFGYSCLARLSNGDIGCVFEGVAGEGEFGEHAGRAVLFARIPLSWLTAE